MVEKKEIFAIKKRIVNIPQKQGNKRYKCVCDETENTKHIYNCEKLSENSEYKSK